MRSVAGSGALDALAALAALDRDRRLAELRVRRQARRSLRAALSRDEAQVRQARDEAGGDPVLAAAADALRPWLQARRRAAAAGLAEALAAEERAAAAARQAFGRAQALAELSRQDHRARRHWLAREAEARLE